jgi:hypothetical protein
VTGLATYTADDASGVVLLLRAIVLPVADFTTVLAGLVLVITEGAVEGGKLAKLVPLQLVLTFRDRCGLTRLASRCK